MKMRDVGTKDEILRISKVVCIGAILFMGLLFNVQLLAGMTDIPSEGVVSGSPLDRLRHVTLQDAVYGIEENYGYTESPSHEPLEVHSSSNQDYEYMADSPYYTVFFDGQTMRMEIGDAWIELELVESNSEEVQTGESDPEDNELSVSGVFDSVDMEYEVDTSLLTESLVLSEFKECERFIYEISWSGVTPEYTETGSLLFSSDGTPVVEILPPFMRDDGGSICTDVHYDLVETETGYELHKVIDAAGQEWLESAQYPVVIDPSMQTFEDAWESSGLTPYGQYFRNLKEYINPANGLLTITQTDLTIPGRGLGLEISRIYQTPAVFYGSDPYDYEAPPTDIGKGWQLNFPYVGSEYLHLWNGMFCKIEWSGSTFTNHKGIHFKLVKNGDDTFTLTTVGGIIYEFNTSGKLTQIKDMDQNTISFTYTSGNLTSINDTIGRTVSLSYSSNRLWKITYNSAEIEFSYDSNGCLQWVEDFLNRRTEYTYSPSNWLLSEIDYPTGGYSTYTYGSFSESNYYKYYVTHQRIYETTQVCHNVFSYTGSFEAITSSTTTVKNESDVTQGSYAFTIDSNGLISQQVTKNASGTPIRKSTCVYDSNKEVTQKSVYSDGSNLSYTIYQAYDNWGNNIYIKDAEGHEKFFSYANTSTSGFFVDNNGSLIRTFTNAFTNSDVPSSVHNALIGFAEKQDSTYVRESYLTYDSDAHSTQSKSSFGNATTWLAFSGTFNEKTGDTSFAVDLTGYTVAGNGALQITGVPSDDIYTENHSGYCPGQCDRDCKSVSGSWSSASYQLNYQCCQFDIEAGPPDYETCTDKPPMYIGPFTHKPGSLGYLSYYTTPSMGQKFSTFTVTTRWKAFPVQTQYNLDNSDWITISSDLKDDTAQIAVPITNGSHTLYFSESSSYDTKFSWYLWVPVDNSPDTYSTSMTYDAYGNITSLTDSESNDFTFTYSSTYSYAYLTEISAAVGQDTITVEATYDSNRGWITSVQQPKGVAASSGYDVLYTYDLLGRVTKKEFPLLAGQSQRSYLEAVYDDTNRRVTIIDQLRHYIVQEYDKLGHLTSTKWYTGTYGSGVLYATESYAYRYDGLLSALTDPENDTYSYTYDFIRRITQISLPDSGSVSYSYDDTNNTLVYTNERGYDRIYWYDWLSRVTKLEEEYDTNAFAVTTYQHDEVGHLTSVTDAENHTTSYTYASIFGLTRVTYPDSEYEEYEYDNEGHVTSFVDCKGNETTYSYDSLYRLTQVQYQDQSTVSFTYDLNGNRTKMEDDAPNTGDYVEHVYDTWDRLTDETRHISTSTYTVSYEYDVASRITELTYPDDMQILYSYDELDRITEIKRYVDGSNDEILMDNVQYDAEGLLTQFDYGNDLRATFSYDSRDRYSTIDIKDGETSYLDLDYTYDSSSNITQIVNGMRDTSSTWHSDTESYSYDGLDRLTSASCASWSHTYSYDKVGNRTARDSVTYTVNSIDEVTALSDGTSFTYDDNGNRTQKNKGTDTWDYTYDYVNRLTKIEKNETTIGEYTYGGYGKRIQATENGVTTTSIYMGVDVLYEENTTGSAAYVYGPRGKLAKRTTQSSESHTFFYHADKLGSTRLVTDENKTIVAAITYHPFGEIDIGEGSEEYLFTGKEHDQTGLLYFGARFYDPGIGKFLTRDPARSKSISSQAFNQYNYCLNNPLKYIDPDGFDPVNCDKYKKREGTYLQHSQAPQNIVFREYEDGHALFFMIMLSFGTLCVVWVVVIVASPEILAFLKWLGPAIIAYVNTHPDAILEQLVDFITDLGAQALNSLVEDKTPEELVGFVASLQKYCEENGIDAKDAASMTNPDGTITVTFLDGSTQTFRQKEDGTWEPVPPSEPSPPSSDNETNDTESGGSGSDDSHIPPVGPVGRGTSIV